MTRRTQRLPPPGAKGVRASCIDRATLAHLGVLFTATFALYARGLGNGFVTDDRSEVLKDHLIRSFANIPRLFSTGVWFFANVKAENFYRPMKLLAYSVEYHLFGFHPLPWHVANLVLHFAVVASLYFLVRDLASAQLAFWSALWFAIHPIHVEAVAWIAGGNDLLCGLALVLALWLYHRGRSARMPAASYAFSVALFFAGLLSKETAMTFPAIIVAYDFFYRQQPLRELPRAWRRYLAYFLVLAIYLALRVRALKGFAPAESGIPLTPWQMIWAVPVLAVKHLWLTFVPVGLNYWHIFVPVRGPGWEPLAAIALILLLLWAMFRLRRTQPLLSLAMAWYWLTLLPALDIPKVSTNVLAERYLYIPSAGFCILAAWAWLWVLHQGGRSRWPQVARGTAYAGLLSVFFLYAAVVIRRLPYWHDSLTLILQTSRQSPGAALIQAELGDYYQGHGDLARALGYAQRAIAIEPTNAYYRNSLFNIFLSAHHYGQALAAIQKAIELNPSVPPFWLNLGAIYNATAQWSKAADACRRGLALDPASSDLLDQLGLAELGLGQLDDAVRAWVQAVRVAPDDLQARINLATAFFQAGQLDAAAKELEAGLDADPVSPFAYAARYKLGVIFEREGRWQAAQQEYEKTQELKPGFSDVLVRLRAVRAHLAAPGP